MKVGRISTPGTNSNKEISPIHRNIIKEATIPTKSKISPVTGIINSATIYSLMSNTKQTIKERSSFSVKTKYLGKVFFCCKGFLSQNLFKFLCKGLEEEENKFMY